MGAALAVVTLGQDGVCVADGIGSNLRAAPAASRVVDVTGAGDALVAGYLAAISRGENDPIGWGLAAASLAVETLETVPSDLSVDRLTDRL